MHQRNSSFYLSITFSLQSKYHFTGYSMYQRNFSSFFYSSSTIFSSYDIRYTILITLFYFLNVKEKSNSSSFSFKLFPNYHLYFQLHQHFTRHSIYTSEKFLLSITFSLQPKYNLNKLYTWEKIFRF